MEGVFADWRFWATMLAIAATWGEARYRLWRYGKILNSPWEKAKTDITTLLEKAKTHGEDIRWLRKELSKETDKREASSARIHDKLDKMGCK